MTDFDLQQQLAAQRRQQYAQQSQFNAPQGQMIGRHYVAPNALQYLASGLRSLGGMRGQQLAEEELGQIQKDKTQAIASALRGFSDMAQGRPADVLPPDQAGPVRPAQAPNMGGAFGALLDAPDPALRQAGIRGVIEMPQIQAQAEQRKQELAFRQEDAAANRQAREEQLKLAHQQRMELMASQNASREQMAAEQRQFQQQMQQERIQSQQLLAGMTMANRPEKMVTVLDPEGNPITMPQSQATGMTPYNPQTAASIKKQKESQQARGQLNEAVGQLKGYYDELATKGGIVSEKQGTVGNILSRMSSSDAGQLIGGAVGTKEQQLRDKIEQTRPLLLNLIKNATGMSAQQMNSNAEMQMYLRAATDPKLSYEANMEALTNIDKLFGFGIGAGNRPQNSGATGSWGASQTPPASSASRRLRFDAQGNVIQ